MASTFGAAFDKLEVAAQRGIIANLLVRKKRYLAAMDGAQVSPKVILLGDTPGPGRPQDPSYHHTPFYSTKNSSLWINRLLWESGVQDSDLLWFNTTLASGLPLDGRLVSKQLGADPEIICLGGNAEKWFTQRFTYRPDSYAKVHHPQAWKRFHSKERYPLLDVLASALDLRKV